MRSRILRKTLRDLRWQVVAYGLGLALLAALVVAIYPSYREQFADFEIPEALEGFIGEADYTSPEGFLSAEFFSFVPVVLVVFAIMAGTSALAGEEANGTIELLLAQPISRRSLALQKMAAITIATSLIVLLAYLGFVVSVPFVDIEIGLLQLALASLLLLPITLVFAMLSIWLAAAIPDRRLATGLVTLIAVASYLMSYLATVVDVLAPARWASIFFYQDGTNVLVEVDPVKQAVVVVAALLFAAAGIMAFERREIGVQGSGWRWPFRSGGNATQFEEPTPRSGRTARQRQVERH